ncbi:MAG: hypothetical protein NTW49_13465 [Bacteroidia bacterium]|nr:hypothetical protein [Bacteroidia bacterium]
MKSYFLRYCILAFITFMFSCNKERFITDHSAKLGFSNDTVLFDTVFTAIGSTTHQLVVHNPHNEWIRISEIRLDHKSTASNPTSNFRLNINGNQSNTAINVEIPPKDSIYIFVEVTVNPNGQNNPMVIQDSITFITNDNNQHVDLVAFGQDCHIFRGQVFNNQTWVNDKPYLIFNSMGVNQNQVLTIEAGCHIHFHHNSSMYVLGTLIVNGTLHDSVIFEGDRLEKMYDDVPGQWGYIHLLAGSVNSNINYAEIKNSIIGIQVDTCVNANPTLILSNTRIEHVSIAGLFAQEATIKAWNCLIADCGQYSVALSIGGSYEFYQTTIANYWTYSNRMTPALVLNNYYKDIYNHINIRPLKKAYFGNCIIYGSLKNEILLDEYHNTDADFSYMFDHCLVRTDSTVFNNSNSAHFIDIIKNLDPVFISTFKYDYHPDASSPAKDKGDPNIGNLFPLDINGISRTKGKPDLGAYEYLPNQK